MPWSVQIVEPVFLEETHMMKKSVAVAALLSIVFPGIGHFYWIKSKRNYVYCCIHCFSDFNIVIYRFYIGYCCLDLGINRCD